MRTKGKITEEGFNGAMKKSIAITVNTGISYTSAYGGYIEKNKTPAEGGIHLILDVPDELEKTPD